MGDQREPGALRDTEGRREVGRRAAALVVGQPEAHDAPSGVLARETRERARVHRVTGAVGRHHHRDRDPGQVGGLRRGVQHQLGERGDPVEARGVAAGVDLDLEPPSAVDGVVSAASRSRRRTSSGGGAPTARRRTGAGSGTSPSRRPPTAAAASRRPATRAGGCRRVRPCSRSVPCASDPVKCRVQVRLGQRLERPTGDGGGHGGGLSPPASRRRRAARTWPPPPSPRPPSPAGGNVGARRDVAVLRVGTRNAEPAGVSATPASLASEITPRGGARQHVQADEVAALGPGPLRDAEPGEGVGQGLVERRRELRGDQGPVLGHVLAHAVGGAEQLHVAQVVGLVRADGALAQVVQVPGHRGLRPREERDPAPAHEIFDVEANMTARSGWPASAHAPIRSALRCSVSVRWCSALGVVPQDREVVGRGRHRGQAGGHRVGHDGAGGVRVRRDDPHPLDRRVLGDQRLDGVQVGPSSVIGTGTFSMPNQEVRVK